MVKRIIIWIVGSGLILLSMALWQGQQIDFMQTERDFIYLSNILYKETGHLKTNEEKLMQMTDWLHENVRHTSKYPSNFNGKGVVNVIKGGVGNCGYQSCNIAVFAALLGMDEHRVYNFQKEKGSKYQHAFAEINVQGKWQVYDPDLMQYQQDESGRVMGLRDMTNNSDLVEHDIFREIVDQFGNDENIMVLSKSWQPTPRPFGKDGYARFEHLGGEAGFRRSLGWRAHGRKMIVIALLLGLFPALMSSYFMKKKKTKKK